MINVRKFILALIFGSLFVFLGFGLCFEAGFESTAEARKTTIVYKKSETHVFSGLKLKGEFKKPDLSYIYQRKGIRSEQIIDIPDDFNVQIREDSSRF